MNRVHGIATQKINCTSSSRSLVIGRRYRNYATQKLHLQGYEQDICTASTHTFCAVVTHFCVIDVVNHSPATTSSFNVGNHSIRKKHFSLAYREHIPLHTWMPIGKELLFKYQSLVACLDEIQNFGIIYKGNLQHDFFAEFVDAVATLRSTCVSHFGFKRIEEAFCSLQSLTSRYHGQLNSFDTHASNHVSLS